MENSRIWFSQKEYRYNAELKGHHKVFSWSNDSEIWDWDNCTVSVIRISRDKIRVVIRSAKVIHSKYRNGDVELRYMLGIDVSNNITEPKVEDYREPPKHNVKNKTHGPLKPRWMIQLDNNYWIWQWTEPGQKIENSEVFRIYLMIKQEIDNKHVVQNNIFDVPAQDDNGIIPVIYQPAIDSWKNFVREVHCNKINDNEYEISILFNNESLREHSILNLIYQFFRRLFYGRIIDVETFRVILTQGIPDTFEFEGIYSGQNDIQKDSVHGDKVDRNGNVPKHKIKYYFSNTKHPIVFINTSNHAMAEFDTNHKLWKWEYLPWQINGPVVHGKKSRQEIDIMFKPERKF